MGGTSTDVAHYDGEYPRVFETQVAGVRMRAPMIEIHTVAAGGGSILKFDGARYRVGPESAGAAPGPACYRRGGPLALTDANLMLGRIVPDFFPHVFGPEGSLPLSLERGYDVTEYTLSCFGGAGGQHACDIADTLGMTTIFLHPLAGVLSAYGMGLADVRTLREQAVEAELDEDMLASLSDTLERLAGAGWKELRHQGVAEEHVEVLRKVHLRYVGTDSALVINYGDLASVITRFEAAHRQRFGFTMEDKGFIVEAVSVEVIGRTDTAEEPLLEAVVRKQPIEPSTHVPMYAGAIGKTHPSTSEKILSVVTPSTARPSSRKRGAPP